MRSSLNALDTSLNALEVGLNTLEAGLNALKAGTYALDVGLEPFHVLGELRIQRSARDQIDHRFCLFLRPPCPLEFPCFGVSVESGLWHGNPP